MAKLPVSVQMYTLRDLTAKDFLGTFRKVKAIGYAGVELAGTGGLPAAELKKALGDMGLLITGAHVSIADLETKFEETATYYQTLGLKHLICPWWPEERRKTEADWITTGKILNEIGGKLKARGITFCYHNHDFEFKPVNGKLGMDLIFAQGTPGNLQMELDCFWVKHAGLEPAAYMAQYPGRVPLLHIKDMQAGPEKKFANVGSGIIDFKPVFAAAAAAGTQVYVVEQDNCYGQDPLEAITNSYNYLKKIGIA